MKGLFRAEWLRLRKRRSLQVIVLALPALATFFFIAGVASIYEPPPVDAAFYRQMYIDGGYVVGLPPEEADRLLDEVVESERVNYAMTLEGVALQRATFAFPQSIVTILGNMTLGLLAFILLTATTIGDEFGWATIRTTLLASSHRFRFLAVRLVALLVAVLVTLALLLLLGGILPFVLNVTSKPIAPLPDINLGALLVYIGGQLAGAFAVVCFATLVTVIVRHGALTLVASLVWVAVEAAVLLLLFKFEPFQDKGDLQWTLPILPVRGISEIGQVAARAASGLPSYTGEVVSRDPSGALLPIAALLVWGAACAALAFRRFGRMDIVE
jgi:ABC-type transport system involved in multi-copper enzyme maturation permease subunit